MNREKFKESLDKGLITFDEVCNYEDCNETVLFFTAPKELLPDGKYTEVNSMEICITFPFQTFPFQSSEDDVSVYCSPTRQIFENSEHLSEDYDWFDVEEILTRDDVRALVKLSGYGNK